MGILLSLSCSLVDFFLFGSCSFYSSSCSLICSGVGSPVMLPPGLGFCNIFAAVNQPMECYNNHELGFAKEYFSSYNAGPCTRS